MGAQSHIRRKRSPAGSGEDHTCTLPAARPRSREEEETAHLHDMRLLPRISVDPRVHPQGNRPGEKVKSDKMYQSQLSSPVPEAELRSGVAAILEKATREGSLGQDS